MNLFVNLKNIDNKLKKATKICFIFCLLIALISAMILSIYHSTYIIFQYNLGITLLRLSIFFFVIVLICAFAFTRIKKDLS